MSETLKLPSIFTDHTVLQRDLPLTIWGWAKPQATVTAKIADQTGSAVADASGRWKIAIKPLLAGGPHELVVAAGSETVKISDVLVGDVWVCSGQSNMEWGLASARGGDEETKKANHPLIRLYQVPKVASFSPTSDIDTKWTTCNPTDAKVFSAVGYFFGREIQRQIGVPIGLINTSWGGTPVECWTPREVLEGDPANAYLLEKIETYKAGGEIVPHTDPGNKGAGMGWADVNFDDSNWPSMTLPCTWHSKGMNCDGSVWFRRTIDVPADWAGKDLQFNPGILNDFDYTYFNGKQVGATGKETPEWWMVQREYVVPGNLVKAGRNTIAIRVFNQWAEGGMTGPADRMRAFPVGEPSRAIELDGDWKYQAELALPHRTPTGQNTPTLLYNAMVAPIVQFGIRGAIWYQGESNASRAAQYRTLFPLMIQSWRDAWGQGDFPFIWVQLANYQNGMDTAAGSPWAELREAQSRTLALPNTGHAVTIDIGEEKDIHPRNKLDVGLRLAHEAMILAYGKTAPRSPMFDSLKLNGATAVVSFKYAADGLTANGQPVGFEVAGEDGKYHPATATIDGPTVTLNSPAVAKPISVRYGWSQNPGCNVFNKAGLPASPFRTDDLPMVTTGVK